MRYYTRRKKRPGRLIILALVVLALLWGAKRCFFAGPGDPRKTAENLVIQAASNPRAAFQSMAEEYQLLSDEESFRLLVHGLGLNELKSVSITASRVEGSKAYLKGTATLKNGAQEPLALTLTKGDGGRWQVLRLGRPEGSAPVPPAAGSSPAGPPSSVPGSGGVPAVSRPGAPAATEMNTLAHTHLYALAASVSADDFRGFHQLAAEMWRKQTNPEALKRAYAPLKPHAALLMDLLAAGKLEVAGASPAGQVGGAPLWSVTGQVVKGRNQLRFNLKLVSDKGRWQMVGLEAALY